MELRWRPLDCLAELSRSFTFFSLPWIPQKGLRGQWMIIKPRWTHSVSYDKPAKSEGIFSWLWQIREETQEGELNCSKPHSQEVPELRSELRICLPPKNSSSLHYFMLLFNLSSLFDPSNHCQNNNDDIKIINNPGLKTNFQDLIRFSRNKGDFSPKPKLIKHTKKYNFTIDSCLIQWQVLAPIPIHLIDAGSDNWWGMRPRQPLASAWLQSTSLGSTSPIRAGRLRRCRQWNSPGESEPSEQSACTPPAGEKSKWSVSPLRKGWMDTNKMMCRPLRVSNNQARQSELRVMILFRREMSTCQLFL